MKITKTKNPKDLIPYHIWCDAQDVEDIMSALSFFVKNGRDNPETRKAMLGLLRRIKKEYFKAPEES